MVNAGKSEKKILNGSKAKGSNRNTRNDRKPESPRKRDGNMVEIIVKVSHLNFRWIYWTWGCPFGLLSSGFIMLEERKRLISRSQIV